MSLLKSSHSATGQSTAAISFVAIGECMVELAPAEAEGQFAMGFAGDTYNTTWYMKALMPDWRTGFVTRVGRDAISDRMLAAMRDAGIDTGHIRQSAERSVGLYLISLTQGERSFSYWRSQSAARQLADDPAALASALGPADLIYFSGITMAILDAAGRRTLLDQIARARADGKTIVFDSNLRPRLWASTDEMRQTVMQAAAVSDILLPSHDDEAAHFGDADSAATLARYREAGAKTVIVKNGPGGIHYAHAGANGTFTPAAVTKITDTTAAGDSFNAGVLAGLARHDRIEDALHLACDVAGHVIGRKGALVNLPARLCAPGAHTG